MNAEEDGMGRLGGRVARIPERGGDWTDRSDGGKSATFARGCGLLTASDAGTSAT